MPFQSALMRRFGMKTPIIQAPMAGGSDTPELAAAVSNAGGLGFIGAAYLSPQQILDAADRVRALTDRPFGVNLFCPWDDPGQPDPGPAIAALAPFFAELGLQTPAAPPSQPSDFEAQLQAVLMSPAAAFSFTFGVPSAQALARVRDQGVAIFGTATTVQEAIQLELAGVDAVIAQGAEAGGHRGTFDRPIADSLIGTMALVPQVADALQHTPVIASGGIMDGRGLAAALALGAEAVQMGTAFLTCVESGASAAYRAALMDAREDQTALTRAFSGRAARGLSNRLMQTVADETVLPFPLQNALTRPLRNEAARQGRAEFLSLWAGQGVGMTKTGGAADLVAEITAQAEAVLSRLV